MRTGGLKAVVVAKPVESPGRRRFLDAVGKVFGVHFRELPSEGAVNGWLFPDAGSEELSSIVDRDLPCYVTIRGDQLVDCGESETVSFSRNIPLPPVLRGLQVRTADAVELKALPRLPGGYTTLASKAGAPVWGCRQATGGCHHYFGLSLPELEEDEPLFYHFSGQRFLRLLPFFIFLRNLTLDERWDPPPLQASFMVDDPNLHWASYGHLNFQETGRHAKEHHYHLAIATIPLDAWCVNEPTASLFRQFRGQLSMLIHGNDHISNELAREYSEKEGRLVVEQALGRIARLENRAGLEVSRVMAPPHGACSEAMLARLAGAGFEAACISAGSFTTITPGPNGCNSFT